LQRGLDHAGVATVSITQAASITRHAHPSLAVFVAHPFGLTLGAPGDDATHLAVARTALDEAERGHPAGTIVATRFRWPDDLRARQLHKQAH
jgi:hypothetical protein